MSTSVKPRSGAFERAMEYLRQRQEARSTTQEQRFTIAISRQRGARGSEIAEEVGRRLGWHVYDRDLVEEIASDKGVASSLVDMVDERHQSWIIQCVESFSSAPTMSEPAYVHRLVQTLASLAAHGACIVVGRGGGFVLPPETTLRIGLVAGLKQRIARFAERNEVTENEAARAIDRIDKERWKFVKDHFHKDARDWHNYDLILNTDRYSNSQCADVIIQALHSAEPGFRATPEGD